MNGAGTEPMAIPMTFRNDKSPKLKKIINY